MKATTSPFILLLAAIGLFSCTNYGDKVSKDFVEVYYKDNISKEQAQQTLDLLYPSWNDSGNQKSVQLIKTGDTVYFRMVVNEEKAKDIKDDSYLQLANIISSSVFNGVPVNVDLTDNNFKTNRSLRFTKMDTEDYGTKISAGNIEVYSKQGVSKEEAVMLAGWLDKLDGDTGDTKSFQLGKNGDGQYIVSMVSDPESSATVPDNDYYDLAGLMSDSVFNGVPLILQLTDNTFKAYQSFKSGN